MTNLETSPPIEIDVVSVHDLQKCGERFLLLDCREPDEYQLVRIVGSIWIPMAEISQRISELEAFREGQIVVHCHHGGRSLRVVSWMRKNGFPHAQNMTGGIDAWSIQVDSSLARY